MSDEHPTDGQAAREGQPRTENDQSTQAGLLLVGRQLKAIANAIETTSDKQNKYNSRILCVNQRTFWSIFVYAAITLGILLINIDQFIETRKITNSSERQAAAAEENIPRSWLYVEFPTDLRTDLTPSHCAPPSHTETAFPPFSCIGKIDQPDGTRSYRISFAFTVHNYGSIPATIETVSAKIYTTDSIIFPGSIPLDEHGIPAPGVTQTAAQGLEGLSGRTIPGDGAIPQSDTGVALPTFTILGQKANGPDFGFFSKWLRITVDYRDPHGTSRKTQLTVKVDRFSINPVTDQKYSFEQ